MQEYIIKEVMKRLPDWVATTLTKNKCYLSGGALTSIVTGKEVNDFDIYFPNRESLLAVVREFQGDNTHCCFISEKSITYAVTEGGVPVTIQLIYYDFYKSAKAIWKHFDYSVNMATLDFHRGKLYTHKDFMLHNSQRYLDFNKNTKFPMISALRIQKYKDRGYHISRTQYMKIMMAVNKLKLNSWEDFSAAVGNLYGLNFIKQEQLTGKFSLAKAFTIIEDTDFDGKSIAEYKFDPHTVDLVLAGETLKYSVLPDKQVITNHCNDQAADLIKVGAVKGKLVSVKDLLGERLYKWVKPTLHSIYYGEFKYTIGEEAISAGKQRMFSKPKGLYCNTAKDLLNNCGSYYEDKVCLELDYKEEDIISVNSNEIVVSKLLPTRVLTKEEFKTEILKEK